jgi:glyceraldehyde-3-phosphate dehydrogenase (NADP+)
MMLTVNNPYDGSQAGAVPQADKEALDRAAAAADAAFQISRKQAPYERADVLHRVAELLKQRRSALADTIVAEAGKPIVHAEAEVDRAVITFTAAAEEARHAAQGQWLDLDGFSSGKNHVGFVKRFPLGVIYGITPFNFPLNLVAHKVAPAVATGNAIIIKPSPRTPLSALALRDILNEAGAVENQVQVVVCPNELATHLVNDDRIRHVTFTGSGPVGWKVKALANTKRVTLELGGNAALIVHSDADLDAAVAAAAKGAFGYAGQSCISVQRIFLHESIYLTFRQMLRTYVREHIKTGDPRDRLVSVGPMIDAAAMQRVQAAMAAATRGGASMVLGGETTGPCLNPAVLENVDPSMDVYRTEIFGPVAVLQAYKDFNDALAMANDSVFGLQAGVFTRDIARAWEAFESLDVGGVMINQAPTWRSDTMPYGGVKQSGFGREGVRYAMEEMTEPRTLVMSLA